MIYQLSLILIITLLLIILVLVFILQHYFRLSETDELTSIPNYRSFRRKIKKVIASYKHNSMLFSVVIVDIDRFRRFNDHSYTLGDIVLKEFVGFIEKELPRDAFIARFRFGDEFIILLNLTAADTTDWIKKTLDKCTGTSQFIREFNTVYTLTFSYGIAGFDPGKDTADTLVERTEKALKENKRLLTTDQANVTSQFTKKFQIITTPIAKSLDK